MKDNLSLFIALPFTLGVFCAQHFSPPIAQVWINCSICASLVGLNLLLIYIRSKSHYVFYFSCFFLLGLLCSYTHTLLEPVNRINPIWEWSNKMHLWLISNVSSLDFKLPNTKSLLLALLCAERSELSPYIVECFRKSGAAHILALSGLHLGIIASLLRRALLLLGNHKIVRAIREISVLCFSALYTIACGMGASLIRALIFLGFRTLSRLLPHRKLSLVNCLLSSCMIQLFFNPKVILSLSFQFSYLACIGVIFIYPKLKNWINYENNAQTSDTEAVTIKLSRKIWEAVAMSISCQLCTAPLSWHRFKTLPKYFILTNLMALPLCEVLITLGLCCIILNTLGYVPMPILFLCEKLCALLLRTLEIIASIP